MNPYPYAFKLAEDLSMARKLGEAAASLTKDGGSMSADLVHIPVGRGCAIHRKMKSFDEVLEHSYRRSGLWRGYFITPAGVGVASARLVSAEAMAKHLAERGWGATVYYSMD